MERSSRLKITVLRRFKPGEVFESPPAKGVPVDACGVYEDGQVFFVEEDGRMPEGFCGWAWDDIYKVVQALRSTETSTGSTSRGSRSTAALTD